MSDALVKQQAEEGTPPAEAEESFDCCKEVLVTLAKNPAGEQKSFICGECGTFWEVILDFSGIAIGWKKMKQVKDALQELLTNER